MIGSGENGALTFVDLLGIMSFAVGLQNLSLNVSQNDLQDQTQTIDAKFSEQTKAALAEIHGHLQEQDKKIDQILRRMELSK